MGNPWEQYSSAPADDSDGPWGAYAAPAVARPTPVESSEPIGFGGALVRGFKRALPETKSLLAGAGAAIAGAVGADGLRDSALDTYREIQREDVAPLASNATFSGVLAGEDNAGEWAADTLGNFGGQAVESIAAMLAGAAVGSSVPGAGNIAGGVAGLVGKTGLKRLVRAKTAEMLAERAATEGGRRVLARGLAGATAGAALNIGQETGISYADRAEDAEAAGEELTPGDSARAIAAGVPAGLLDTLAEGVAVSRLARGVSSNPKALRRVAAGAGIGAVTEGATEAGQAVLERAGAGRELTGEEAYTEYLDNAAAGALGGGVIGGGGGLRRATPDEVAPPAKPLLGLPAPDNTVIVDENGVATTGAQRTVADNTALQAAQAEQGALLGEGLHLRDSGQTADVRAAQTQHPGFTRAFPDAPTGSIADAANTLATPAPIARAPVTIDGATGELLSDPRDAALTPEPPLPFPEEPSDYIDDPIARGASRNPPSLRRAPNPEAAAAAIAAGLDAGRPIENMLVASTFGLTLKQAKELRSQVQQERRHAAPPTEATPTPTAAAPSAPENPPSTATEAPPSSPEPREGTSTAGPEYDDAEEVLDSDVTAPSGPFTLEGAAKLAADREGPDARVVPVEGGFVVRRPKPPVVADAHGFIEHDGQRIRIIEHTKGSNVLDPAADHGALVYEVRGAEGDRRPLNMVLAKTGKLVQTSEAFEAKDGKSNTSNGVAWVPPNAQAAAHARALLTRRASTSLLSDERKAIDAELKALVADRPSLPTGGDAPATAAQEPARVPAQSEPAQRAAVEPVGGALPAATANRDAARAPARRRAPLARASEAGPVAAPADQPVAVAPKAKRKPPLARNPAGGSPAPVEKRDVRQDEVPAEGQAAEPIAGTTDGQARELTPRGFIGGDAGQALEARAKVGELPHPRAGKGWKGRPLAELGVVEDGAGWRMRATFSLPSGTGSGHTWTKQTFATEGEARAAALDAIERALPKNPEGGEAKDVERVRAWLAEQRGTTPDEGGKVDGDTPPAAAEAPATEPVVATEEKIAAAAAEAATSPDNDLPAPTEAQIEAGNYRKGHVWINGLDVSIENPAGSRRRPEWPPLVHHYGYIKRTEGADGEHIDVFVSEDAGDAALPVFVVDQFNKDGGFDEHKVMLGFADEDAARAGYAANYTKGWKVGPITRYTLDEFKAWLREGDTTQPAAPETSTSTSKPSDKIEDFGETLHGARKHYAAAYAERAEDALSLDVSAVPLSKSWPEPDYEKMLEGGADPFAVAFAHAARDEIPSRPTQAWKLKGWVAQVRLLRDFAYGLFNGTVSPESLRSTLAAEQFATVRRVVGGRAELYQAVGHADSLKGITLAEHHYTLYRGQKDVHLWVVEGKAKATAWSNWPRELATGKTKAEAIEAFRAATAKRDAAEQVEAAAKKPRFVIYSRKFQQGFIVGVKVRGNGIDLRRFNDVKEARAYLADHEVELTQQWEALKQEPPVRGDLNAPRIGVDHRHGADVSAEQFEATFGFRGVQFGNYVEGKRRQQDLNNAYDALMDLAGVLGIPPRALSLNGTLGLAFGARGKGGKNAGAAHYEPAQIVINLTKNAGAGSLAHEWWHSLDNYFATVRRGSKSLDLVTEVADRLQVKVQRPLEAENLRPVMLSAFYRVVNAINDTALRERSRKLDERRSKDYWTTGHEMSARSFESYVIAKLKDANGANDYLANVVSEASFSREAGEYPYPLAAEMPRIREAFDSFFQTVEAREEGGNVRLFSQGEVPSGAGLSLADANAAIAPMLAGWTGPRVHVLATAEGLPQEAKADSAYRTAEGYYANDGRDVYLVAGNLSSAQRAREVLLHEAIGHAGIEAITGPETWAAIGETVARMRASGQHVSLFAEVDRRYPDAKVDADTKLRETIAAMAEKGIRNSVMDRVIAALRRFLRGLGVSVRLSEAELRQHLVAAARAVRGGRTDANPTERAPAMVFSRPDDFGRWFAGSKAVDDNGKPLVLYHGTTESFDQFDPAKRGTATHAPSAKEGFFFASNPETARTYATGSAKKLRAVAGREPALRARIEELTGTSVARVELGYTRAALFGGENPYASHPQAAEIEAALDELAEIHDVQGTETDDYFGDDSIAGEVKAVHLALKNPLVVDYLDGPREESFSAAIARAKAAGHDGAIFRNVEDEGGIGGDGEGTDVYVAFEPEQIRPAAASNGLFSRLADSAGKPLFTFFKALGKLDDAFQYPISDKDTLDGVLAEVGAADKMRVIATHSARTDFEYNGESLPATGYVIQVGDDPAHAVTVYVEKGGEGRMFLDASTMEPGYGGTALYMALFNYANNAGKLFVGDPHGLSDAALLRRTELMAAAALRHGGTWFMRPHPRQLRPNVAWAAAVSWGIDPEANLESLLSAAYNNVLTFAPGVADVVFDFQRNEYRGVGGESVSIDRLDRLAAGARTAFARRPQPIDEPDATRAAAFGRATIARAVLAHSVLRRGREGGPGLVDELAGRAGRGAGQVAGQRVLYSQPDTAGTITLSPDAHLSVKDKLKAKLTDLKPALLGAIPLNYLADYAPASMPGVKQFIDLRQQLEAFRNGRHRAMDAIAQDWLKYATVGGWRGWLGKASQPGRDLADLMHDATIAGVDPARPRGEYAGDDAKLAMWDKLRARFDAMPEEGRRLYTTVRDAYGEQTRLVEEALEERFRKAATFRRDQADREYVAKLEDIDDSDLDTDAKVRARAEAGEKHDRALRAATSSAAGKIAALRKLYESMRIEAPYFPLKRFGRYSVAVRKDGRSVGFSKFETAAEMQAFMREKAAAGFNVSGWLDTDREAVNAAVDPVFIADLDEILADEGIDDNVRDAIYQRYLETLPDLSLRKQFIHRKKTPGYNPDALRAFSSVMFHGSYQLARLKYGLDMQAAHLASEEQAKRSSPVQGMALANELGKRLAWVMNPQGGVAAQAITSAAFVWHLGANPAHLFLNATQTIMLGIPILGARYGFARTNSALAKAARDFASGRGHIERGANLTGDERRAMEDFLASGLIDKSQAHDLAGVGDTGAEYSALRARVMAKLGWFFHQSERLNREVTALAAYRLARGAGAGHDEAVKRASDHTWSIHFDYSAANRARYMQGDVAKVLTIFRNYNVNVLYRLFRDIHTAFRGETEPARREAARQLGAMLGMYGLMAGVAGMPFYGLLVALASAFDDEDEPFDAETRFKEGIVGLLGEDAARVLLGGVPGAVTSVDLTSRIGLPNLWFRSPDRELEGRDAYYYWMEQVAGAGASIPKAIFTGLQTMHEGHVERGVEAMLPNMAKSPVKAFRYAMTGQETNFEGDKLAEVGAGGAIARFLGFTPATLAEQYDTNRALKNAESKVAKRRQRIINTYALAREAGDREGVAEALMQTRRFNAANPAFAIRSSTFERSLRARLRNDRLNEGGIVLTKRLRAIQAQQEALRE